MGDGRKRAVEAARRTQKPTEYQKALAEIERLKDDDTITRGILADLRASQLRMAKALVETAASEYGIVPRNPLAEAEAIVKEEG